MGKDKRRPIAIPLAVSAALACLIGVLPGVVPESTAATSRSSMPVGNLTGWRQTLAEDFNSSAPLGSFQSVYGRRFQVYSNSRDTSGRGRYSPRRTLSVAKGRLKMHLHSENGQPLVAAVLPRKANSLYGRYSIRFRADPVPGYKNAWMLWPNSNKWPQGGEIDFPEGGLNSHVKAFMHYARTSGGQDVFTTRKSFGSWHVSTVEWTPGKVRFFLDGTLIGTSTQWVPSKAMHWVIQCETRSGRKPSPRAAGNVEIDWMVAYSYAP